MMIMVFLCIVIACIFWGIMDLLGLYPKEQNKPRHTSFTIDDYERAAMDPNDPMHNFVTYDMLQWLHDNDPSEFPDYHHGG